MTTGLGRRAVLASACGIACGAAFAGCAGYGPGRAPAAAPAPPGTPLVATADVPVGGGVIFADRDTVVTQPVEGEFKAFTATCTHEGCVVATVTTTINCTCHGSSYAVADGSVVAGPAPRPLAEKPITVTDGVITAA